jgi:glycosyltransferase involved in cell wall biosynthesis
MAPSEGSDPPRIAVVAPGDVTDRKTWSGSPAGLFNGLAEAGVEPLAVNSCPPGTRRLYRRLGISWSREATNPLTTAAASVWTTASIAAAGRVDGVVTIGSGHRVRTSAPIVSYDDMTFAQGQRQAWSPVSELGRSPARRWRQRQQRAYLRNRACCLGSEWAARSVREDYGIDPEKVHIVGFGRNFAPAAAERDWSVPRFIFIGVEWERKRGPAVVDALAEVRASHPQATLDVVGEHPPIDAPGVIPHGRLSLASREDRAQLEDLLARATCLVLPSTFEAFGIAQVDAGAAGVPSIGTTVGGAPDAVGDGGLVVPPDDPVALVAAMLELADPETARRLGELALAHSALFTWQAVAERVLRALRPSGLDASGLAEFLEPAAFYASSERSLRSAR